MVREEKQAYLRVCSCWCATVRWYMYAQKTMKLVTSSTGLKASSNTMRLRPAPDTGRVSRAISLQARRTGLGLR